MTHLTVVQRSNVTPRLKNYGIYYLYLCGDE